MKFLQCLLCNGEIDIIGSDSGYTKFIKCTKCDFITTKKEPEIMIIKKKKDKIND